MNSPSLKNSVYDTTIRLLILLLIIAWCLMLMSPFVSVILWSIILALALYPPHSKLSKKLGGKSKWASFIIIFCILVTIIIPTFLLVSSLVQEVSALKTSYYKGALTIPPPTVKVKEWPIIGESLFSFWKGAADNIGQTIIHYKDQLISTGKTIASGILSTVTGLIQILLSLLIAGVLLAFGGVGEGVHKFFRKVGGNSGDKYANIVLKTVGSVVNGILGESLVMAILFGIAFMLAGVPYAGIWTLVVFVFAIVQIPTILVTAAMIVYFFSVKETMPAVLWSVVLILVGLVDNILTPLMLGKSSPVPMPVIFIGTLGGFSITGFSGLFTGAIIMSLGYNLFIEWINTENIET